MRQPLLIGRFQGCNRGADVKFGDATVSTAAHCEPKCWVFDELEDRFCHSVDVVRPVKEPGITVDDGFPRSIHTGCNDWKPGSHCLRKNTWQAFPE